MIRYLNNILREINVFSHASQLLSTLIDSLLVHIDVLFFPHAVAGGMESCQSGNSQN